MNKIWSNFSQSCGEGRGIERRKGKKRRQIKGKKVQRQRKGRIWTFFTIIKLT
jgi:hypothetical protein